MQSLLDYTDRWHDTWEVLGAIATALAVVVALVGIAVEAAARRRAERRAERAEQARDAERRRADSERAAVLSDAAERARIEQALQVIAWVEAEVIDRWQGAGGNSLETTENRGRIVNHSTAPVFDAVLLVHNTSDNTTERVGRAAVLPGGADRTVTIGAVDVDTPYLSAELRFRDLAGQYWLRRQDGELIQTDVGGEIVARIVGRVNRL